MPTSYVYPFPQTGSAHPTNAAPESQVLPALPLLQQAGTRAATQKTQTHSPEHADTEERPSDAVSLEPPRTAPQHVLPRAHWPRPRPAVWNAHGQHRVRSSPLAPSDPPSSSSWVARSRSGSSSFTASALNKLSSSSSSSSSSYTWVARSRSGPPRSRRSPLKKLSSSSSPSSRVPPLYSARCYRFCANTGMRGQFI